jgi:hypothetical protein
MKDYNLDPEIIRASGVIQAMINIGTVVPKLSPTGRSYARKWIESYLDTLISERRVGRNKLTEHEVQQLTQIGVAILSMLNQEGE